MLCRCRRKVLGIYQQECTPEYLIAVRIQSMNSTSPKLKKKKLQKIVSLPIKIRLTNANVKAIPQFKTPLVTIWNKIISEKQFLSRST